MRHDWFNIQEIDRDVFAVEEPGHVRFYLVRGAMRAALIDTGMGFCDVRSALSSLVKTPLLVLNTHWHFDHIGGNAAFRDIGIGRAEEQLLTRYIGNDTLMRLYIRPCLEGGIPLPAGFLPERYEISSPPATFTVNEGDTFDLGGRTLAAIATPGHTHGSFSFLDSDSGGLFCGDVVYKATLYAHFRDSDSEEYIASLHKLLTYGDSINCLYPGHCDRILPTSFLGPVLEAFRAIEEGTASGRIVKEWGEPVVRHEFDDFAILTKRAGSQGVDLLQMGKDER